MKNTIRFERQGAIGRIVLANPPRNLLDRQFSECLRQAVHDASESDIYKTQKKLVFCPTTKRLEACGTMRADFFRCVVYGCPESEVMHVAS